VRKQNLSIGNYLIKTLNDDILRYCAKKFGIFSLNTGEIDPIKKS